MALYRVELVNDPGFVLLQFFRHWNKTLLQFAVLRLIGQCLGPVQNQVKMAAAIVELPDLREGDLLLSSFSVAMLMHRRVFCLGIAGRFRQVLQRHRQGQKLTE